MEPDIVIFDEPDSGLDPVRTALLCDLIQEMHKVYGGTYIVVTHNIASARQIGEYIALLWRGRIVEAGDAERMFSSDNAFVRQFLSGSAEGPLTMDSGRRCGCAGCRSAQRISSEAHELPQARLQRHRGLRDHPRFMADLLGGVEREK